jgi:ribosomal protein S18 acetylase RimI-like enzyme
MAELQVRESTAGDLHGVGAAWLKLQRFHQSLGMAFPVEDGDQEKWLASFQRTLGRFSFLWVIGESGNPNAFLLARLKQSPAFLGGVLVGEISDLYVDESLRGSGAGTQLVDVAAQKFQELNVHSVEVQIQAGNDAGLAFWIKQGFKQDLTLVRKAL